MFSNYQRLVIFLNNRDSFNQQNFLFLQEMHLYKILNGSSVNGHHQASVNGKMAVRYLELKP